MAPKCPDVLCNSGSFLLHESKGTAERYQNTRHPLSVNGENTSYNAAIPWNSKRYLGVLPRFLKCLETLNPSDGPACTCVSAGMVPIGLRSDRRQSTPETQYAFCRTGANQPLLPEHLPLLHVRIDSRLEPVPHRLVMLNLFLQSKAMNEP